MYKHNLEQKIRKVLEETDVLKICVQSGNWYKEIDLLPEDVKEDGLKLVSTIGRSFRKKIVD